MDPVKLSALAKGDCFIHLGLNEVHTVIGYERDASGKKTVILTRNHRYPEPGALGNNRFSEDPDMTVDYVQTISYPCLTWEQMRNTHTAKMFMGHYEIKQQGDVFELTYRFGACFAFLGGQYKFNGLDEAKANAEAHFKSVMADVQCNGGCTGFHTATG